MDKDYKLIVVEGVDSSGKATQSAILKENLLKLGKKVESIEFPNYDSESSAVVKMYLGGEFGDDPNAVSPYAASMFFAVDRMATVNVTKKEIFTNGNIVVADRYTTSNMVHQASKIDDADKKSEFLDWLYDMEYEKLSLPKPDMVIFLDMPVENARELMAKRANKIDNSQVKDIHERNADYLQKSYDNAVFVANKYEWTTVHCAKDGKVRSIEEISEEILAKVKEIL
ncbi:MAG: thymidylate kinase [Ruminococcaceae bacterium]|nr:thymidylate kinase [Oscillospiraceae bacterium]